MTEEMLAAWYILNAAAARLQRMPASKLTAALEELESARLAFGALVEVSLPKPPAEKKSPRPMPTTTKMRRSGPHTSWRAFRATGSTSMHAGAGTASAIEAPRTNGIRRSAPSP